jgi:hypothetical protein
LVRYPPSVQDRKLFEKLRRKTASIENLVTEMNRIHAKEGSQGGLTDGQVGDLKPSGDPNLLFTPLLYPFPL